MLIPIAEEMILGVDPEEKPARAHVGFTVRGLAPSTISSTATHSMLSLLLMCMAAASMAHTPQVGEGGG